MLVNVGEGMIPDDVRQPFVDSAGGDTVVIAVLPQSLQRAERGKASVTEFLGCGVAEAYVFESKNRERVRGEFGRATTICFPGGSQRELYAVLKRTTGVLHGQDH
jgi:hypothetical protein